MLIFLLAHGIVVFAAIAMLIRHRSALTLDQPALDHGGGVTHADGQATNR
ncbi:MAG: hypothetical protein ABEJ28_11905 [Salinigranum sp.]